MSSYLLGERSMRFDRTEDFTRRDYPDETMTTHVNYLGADNDVSYALFDDFFVQSSSLLASDILTLMDNFEKDMVNILRRLLMRSVGSKSETARLDSVLQQIYDEQFIWRLLRVLIDDRLQSAQKETQNSTIEYSDDRAVFNHLLANDTSFREMTLLLNWCEQKANERIENANVISDLAKRPILWNNTLHKRKHGGVGCDLDPDGPLHGKLDEDDAEYHRKLLNTVFSLVRCGSTDKAVDLCIHCGFSWLAAVIRGKTIAHDPNLHSADDADRKVTIGNRRRHLWKSACWQSADNPKLPMVERCLYSAISGRLEPLLTACNQWEDRLWAYCTAAVEYRLSSALELVGKRAHPTTIGGVGVSRASDRADFTVEKIFQELHATARSAMPYQQLVKHIMMNDMDGVVVFMFEWLDEHKQDYSTHILRLMAHIVLVLRQLNIPLPGGLLYELYSPVRIQNLQSSREMLSNRIIDQYTRLLIEMPQTDAIAFYAFQLPSESANELFVSYMLDINESGARRELLKRAFDAGFDTNELCRRVVTTTYESVTLPSSGDDTGSNLVLSDESIAKLISSLEWFTLTGNQPIDTLIHCNSIIRLFLLMNKADDARTALNMIARDIIDQCRRRQPSHRSESTSPSMFDSICKEFIGLRVYLDAHDAFNRWFAYWHGQRPPAPPDAASRQHQLTLRQRAEFDLQANRHLSDMQRWKQTSALHAESARQSLVELLQFPGGWLVDIADETDDDDVRPTQLRQLRKQCIQRATTMLITLLDESGDHNRALAVADLLADERYSLYKVFDKEAIRRVLAVLRDCAIHALE